MNLFKINYGTTAIDYSVVRKPLMKNTYISVARDGVIVKTDTSTSISEIEKLVQKKASWISRKLEEMKSKVIHDEIKTGSRLYYLGKSYYVNLINSGFVGKIDIQFTHSKFNITVPERFTQVELYSAIDEFYKVKAIDKITPYIKQWSSKTELNPSYVGYRQSRTRWGSCSASNRISFNYHLMKLSSSLIEYVVVHELCHIQHKNHGKEFWGLVKKHLPDYEGREAKIKSLEKLI